MFTFRDAYGRKPAVGRDRSISPSPYPQLKGQSGRPSSTVSPASGKQTAITQGGGKAPKQQAKVRPKSSQETKATRQAPPSEPKPGKGKKSPKGSAMIHTQTQAQLSASLPQQQVLPISPAMPAIGTGTTTPEVSPKRTNNRTPEPTLVPTKRIKRDSEQSSDSSSGSSSDSSESESDMEETSSQMTLSQPTVTTVTSHSALQLLPLHSHTNQVYASNMTQPAQTAGHQPLTSSSSSSGTDSDSDSSSSSGSSSGSSDQENDNEVVRIHCKCLSLLYKVLFNL